ncbi:MAG: TIGR03000 domain-containing protein [Planctomycetes bacterium]|nr:TIGR03000 domain-containing protein [Planctomycetota bacterium]
MLRFRVLLPGVAILLPSALFATAALAGEWRYGGPLYAPSYPDPYPPSYYGYDLDNTHPGYYGGLNYREYYNFGRGYGLADFPGPVPHLPYCGRPFAPRRSAHPPFAGVGPSYPILAPGDPVALLEVRVPAQAEVWLEGNLTQQTGTLRQFVTPPLPQGQQFAYQIKVRWREADRDVEQIRNVTVRAGDRLRLSIPSEQKDENVPLQAVFPERQGTGE